MEWKIYNKKFTFTHLHFHCNKLSWHWSRCQCKLPQKAACPSDLLPFSNSPLSKVTYTSFLISPARITPGNNVTGTVFVTRIPTSILFRFFFLVLFYSWQSSTKFEKRKIKGLFTWSGGPRTSGVGFFCFHALGDTKQKELTPLDRGPPLHVNRV